jgi:hypothetical protein
MGDDHASNELHAASKPERVGFESWLGGFALLRTIARKQRDRDHPTVVLYSKRTSALVDKALSMANEGREDENAVRELVVAARRRQGELRRAAAALRHQGWVDDSEEHDRANRLLLAAADRQPVPPLTPERQEWFRLLRSLQEGPVDTGYALLASRQPALHDLEDEVREAANRKAASLSKDSVAQRTEALWEVVGERFKSLVGPEATDAPDPLLRTRTALLLADRNLSVTFGLPDPAEHSEET